MISIGFVTIFSIVTIGAFCNQNGTASEMDSNKINDSNGNVNIFPTGGQQNVPRIAGGNKVVPNSIAYQVALNIYTTTRNGFCGGSLISIKYVLTAAHCLDSAIKIQVILGAYNIAKVESSQQRYISTEYKIHELYNRKTLIYDIGVVQLPSNAILNDYVQLVSLPKLNAISKNWFRKAKVSGWGKTSVISNGSPVLKEATLKIIPNFICGTLFHLNPGTICTFWFFKNSGCEGDSGGPLVLDNTQIGIVSYGLTAICDLGLPTVFTSVQTYLRWIKRNTDVPIY